MKNNFFYCMLFLIVTLSTIADISRAQTTSVDNVVAKKQFMIYDSFGYRNMPDLERQFGVSRLKVYSKSHFWGEDADLRNLHGGPTSQVLADLANEASINKYNAVSIDIEHWKLDGPNTAAIEANIAEYLRVIKGVRAGNAHLPIGLYGTLPIRNYWDALNMHKFDSDNVRYARWEVEFGGKYAKWEENNKRLQKVADQLDVIMPSLYTFFNNPADWKIYAEANIKQARQYGKPVYVFLWPEYHQANANLRNTYIDKDFWALQLRTAYEHADGIIFWSRSNEKGREAREWNNGPWWQETVKFLEQVEYVKSGQTSAISNSKSEQSPPVPPSME